MATSRVGRTKIARSVIRKEIDPDVQAIVEKKALHVEAEEWSEWMPSLIEALEYGVLDDHLHDIFAAARYRLITADDFTVEEGQKRYEDNYLDGEPEYEEAGDPSVDLFGSDDTEEQLQTLNTWTDDTIAQTDMSPTLVPGVVVRTKKNCTPAWMGGLRFKLLRRVRVRGGGYKWKALALDSASSPRKGGRYLNIGDTVRLADEIIDPEWRGL